jgi:hypothetical protein
VGDDRAEWQRCGARRDDVAADVLDAVAAVHAALMPAELPANGPGQPTPAPRWVILEEADGACRTLNLADGTGADGDVALTLRSSDASEAPRVIRRRAPTHTTDL